MRENYYAFLKYVHEITRSNFRNMWMKKRTRSLFHKVKFRYKPKYTEKEISWKGILRVTIRAAF